MSKSARAVINEIISQLNEVSEIIIDAERKQGALLHERNFSVPLMMMKRGMMQLDKQVKDIFRPKGDNDAA